MSGKDNNDKRDKKDKSKDQKAARKDMAKLQKDFDELNKQFDKLQEKFDELQDEKAEVFGQLQRVSADYSNFQKRVPKQVSDSVAYEKERIIRSVLPAMDNFEHVLANAATAEDVAAVVKGVEIVYSQMLDILKSHGVEQVRSVGEKFDPAVHEAMMRREDPEQDEDIVLEEFQKGYRMGDRVIRPGKVIVNKREVAAEQAEEDVRGEGQADNGGEAEQKPEGDTE